MSNLTFFKYDDLGTAREGGPLPERVIEGDAKFKNWDVEQSADEKVRAGVWETTPGTYRSIKGGTAIEVEYTRYYPATVNSPEHAQLAIDAARSAGLEAQVAAAPAFTSEDFAFMLQQRPGAYLWLGQRGADHAAPLHHPSYDFNDDVLACGVRWFAAVAQMALR